MGGPHAAIISQCASRAAGDPASLGLCLASHGVVVQANGKMYACLQSAGDRTGVTACLTKYAQ